MSTELAVIEPQNALALNMPPDTVLHDAREAARAIQSVIEGKPKKVVFNGKTYLQFEDWQTLGRFYGVTAIVKSSKYVEFGEGDSKVAGFEAVAEALLVSTNQVISSAEALCLNDETNWARKPLYQLKSMAQTRACAKAMRNVLAWVAVLAGYAGTPAEEMGEESSQPYVQSPKRKSEKPQTIEAQPAEVEALNDIFPPEDEGKDEAGSIVHSVAAISAHSGQQIAQRVTKPVGKTISEAQGKRLFAIAKGNKELISRVIGKYGYENSRDIVWKDYEAICNEVGA